MKGAVIAAIILVAFVGAAFAATLTATPNQVGVGEFVITEGSGFVANIAITTATIYDPVPQFKIGRINNNVAFGPSRSKFFSPETNNGAASYGVNLTVDDGTKTTDIGVNATYILTVTNTGNATDSFNLTCTNPDIASVVGLNKTQVTLVQSATETVSLNVTNATVGIGTFRVNVTATSQNESNKTDYINTTTTIAIYGVTLTVDDETKTTDVGENATYILTVTNTGNVDDSFNLTFTNPDIASVMALNKTQVTLIPLATETVSLNVTNATVGIGTFRVNVTASSLNETNKTDYINTTTTIAIYGVTLTVDDETKTTDVGENATYILTVTNTGNADDSFNLTVTNQDNASVVALNKTQATLSASATETVSLNVSNATIGTFRVNVTATSQGGDSSKSDFVNTTTTVDEILYGVNLTVDNETKTTDVGENATYILTVTNTGNADDSFNLTVTNPDNASVVALNKTQVMLSPSATEKVSLNVGNATIGTFRVNVTATSQGDLSKSDFVNTTTTVDEIHYGVNLTVDNETKTTDVGENVTYILTVTNTGNADDSFNLTVINQDNASVVALNKTQVMLSPSATEKVSLNVGNATIGTFRVNVTATSQGDLSESDFVNTTTTVVPVAVYGVDLTVDEEAKTTVEGENATYILTVNNTGNVADSFNLTFTNPDNASVVYLNKTQVTLIPSATETVSLNVGNATVGTFWVNVTATSQNDDTSKSDSINTMTTVATYGVNLTVDEEAKTAVEGENATYILTVNNTGSVVDTFNLTYTNPDNASVVVLNKTQVTLSASATETVSLNVGNATIGTFRVNVTATSLNDSNKADYVSTMTTVATYGVNLTVDAEAKTTDEGENATYILTVNNTGSVVDTFNITYTNPDNASVVVLNKTQVTLSASTTETVSLIVTNYAVGTFRINITAISQGDSSKITYVNTMTIVATYGVNLTVDAEAKTIVEGKNVTYMLTVNNTGSIEDTFNLTYSNLDNASVVDLNRTQITLNASESGVVALNVGNAAVGTFRVNVTVTSQGDSSKTAFVNTTTTVTNLTVRPLSVNVGDFVTIEGTGFEANKTVTLSCSVSDFEIPVSDGEYKYSLEDFNLSDSNTSFSLSVQEVENNMTVNITTPLGLKHTINNYSPNEYGLVFDYDSTNKTATVYSTESLPVGIYKLIEVSGTAVGSAIEVYANFTVNNIVMTNATGYFETVIDTHGLPPREYTITVDGVETTLTVCRLTVTPDSVMVGEFVTIKGEGFGANDSVALSSHVSDFKINVSDNKYEYSLEDFNLSDSNTGFSLSVRAVKDDMEVRLKKQGWTQSVPINEDKYGFEFEYNNNTNMATVSIPIIDSKYTGIYELIKVSGTAVDAEVYMNMTVTNIVTANATGCFETVIDTHGFPPMDYTIHATSATASAEATLKVAPATGSIYVTSTPSGAVIELDGKSTPYITNVTIPDVDPGAHSIKLTLDGYQDWSTNVTVTAGITSEIHADLKKPTPTPTPGGRGGGGGGSSGPNDIDGDGYCNIDEIIMGSDPEDPCDPDPDCVACLALGKPTLVVPAPTPRPTATVKYLQTPTPRPTPTPSATATPTSKPLFPVLGPDKPILLIVIIIAVLVLIGTLFFLHRKFKKVDSESQNNDKIVWR